MQVPPDFNEMLHWLRSKELQNTQPVPETMVSVGASDLGYFHWIDGNLGRPAKHIGLEFYRPKPEGLPDNVVWVANTAGNMCDVESGVVDLVFAGQTIEHLWYEELAGFFTESARVLKPGGRLVFDSPNRLVTSASKWNHPEHTVELTHEEASELARLAGFDVRRCVGHWKSLDNGALLPLTEIAEMGEWSAERRVEEGVEHPGDSFSWWIEAVRSERRCDTVAVFNLARKFSQDLFPERIGRLMQSRVPVDGVAVSAKGEEAWLVFGPLAPLPPGRWIVRFTLDPYEAEDVAGRAEIGQTETGRILATVDLPSRFAGGAIDVPVELTGTVFGLEFRLWSNGAAAMRSEIGVEILSRGIA